MAEIEKTMFREYDIRGRVNDKELNDRTIEILGRAFGTMLRRKGRKECVLGYDARSYSVMIRDALVKGLTNAGIDIIDIGRALSPITYFAQYHLDVRACAMITASHNPNGWSGFKFGYDFSSTLLPEDNKELYNMIRNDDFEEIDKDSKGIVRKIDVIDSYIENILKRVNLGRGLKVVINVRNGTPGPIVPDILRRAGCDVVEQFCNIDMSFPNGNPNPSLEDMLKELGDKVVEEGADVGFAIDGDGDRIGMVDERGQTIYPDRIMIILSRLVLQKRPGAKIVFDVKSTQALIEDIEAHGGEPVMWITGHSYIKDKVHKINAALGGERSGHIFFMEDYYGFDDAVFSCLKVLEYISQGKESVSSIMDSVPKYYSSPVIHAPCPDEVKYDVIERIAKDLKQKFDRVIDINGIRVVFEDGWALVRPSSNLPVMVIVFEARSPERLKEIESLFRKELERFPEISKDWENG